MSNAIKEAAAAMGNKIKSEEGIDLNSSVAEFKHYHNVSGLMVLTARNRV